MKIKIKNLSAASRKRVTRRIHNQLRYLWCWYGEALIEATFAEMDGDLATAAKWNAEASSLLAEYSKLEKSLS